MAGVNKAIIVGNLGGDPEVRYTPGGKAVANFTVATSEQWKDKDGNKLNNNIDNLEWCTHKENMRHAFEVLLIPKFINPKGEKSISAKLTDSQVLEIKRRLRNKEHRVEIAKDYPVTEGAIGEIKAGRSWGHLRL